MSFKRYMFSTLRVISLPLKMMKKLLFWRVDEDFEKKLQHLSKEEIIVLTRMKRRTSLWRKIARFIILYSVCIQFFLVSFMVLAFRSETFPFQIRGSISAAVFAFPLVAYFLYNCCAGITRFYDKSDSKLLENLRKQRKAKIEELKERTNFYATQQLIQKFDPDSMVKVDATNPLGPYLDENTDLKANLARKMDSPANSTQGQIFDTSDSQVHSVASNKVRRRRNRKSNRQTAGELLPEGTTSHLENILARELIENESGNEKITSFGGWFARIAALLVGEDPTQCYALICERCFMHNGLSRKEDFPFITYYCPRCNHLNKSQNFKENDQNIGEQTPREQRNSVSRESDLRVVDTSSPLLCSKNVEFDENEEATTS